MVALGGLLFKVCDLLLEQVAVVRLRHLSFLFEPENLLRRQLSSSALKAIILHCSNFN